MNPEALNTGDSDLSHMAANSHEGLEKRCGEHNAFALRCAGRLTLALKAVVDSLVTSHRANLTNHKSVTSPSCKVAQPSVALTIDVEKQMTLL